MSNKQETKEKICTFFVSDFHFEMKSLHYICESLKNEKTVVILTENNLEDTFGTLLSRTILSDNMKKKLLNINWKNDDLHKFKEIKKDIDDNKELVVFIKGKENYIENVNKNIEKWTENYEKVKIVDCYDMEEVGENIDTIVNKYKKILNSSGITDEI